MKQDGEKKSTKKKKLNTKLQQKPSTKVDRN